ncbi:DUF4062 domain-containing protein [Geodermatophilus sp. URMC 62]|uniref:DUF4062 domain-containing protein n=1 Tax=Geodermatophilus sp. URMC 62 TaxID=3423414 RepID=UPI00406D2237
MTDKHYQVFVSSTYKDLIEERQHVSEQLLRSRCIPSGMELFTASGRPPWAVIESALDTTDYMILILAGRYGSVDSEGISFTEREYDYAISLKIPVVAFLHEDPDGLPSKHVDTGEQAERLTAFRKKVSDSERHTVEFWRDANDLARQVSNAMNEAMRSEPRPGWIRVGMGNRAVVEQAKPSSLEVSDVTARLVAFKGSEHRLEILSASGEARELRWVLPQDKGEWHIPPTKAALDGESVQYPLSRLRRGQTLRVPAVARGRVRPLHIEFHWETGIGSNAKEHRLEAYLEAG